MPIGGALRALGRFGTDVTRGLSEASNQLPQAMAARQRLMMQQQETERGQAMRALEMAMASRDPAAITAAWTAAEEVGAIPQAPEIPTVEAPGMPPPEEPLPEEPLPEFALPGMVSRSTLIEPPEGEGVVEAERFLPEEIETEETERLFPEVKNPLLRGILARNEIDRAAEELQLERDAQRFTWAENAEERAVEEAEQRILDQKHRRKLENAKWELEQWRAEGYTFDSSTGMFWRRNRVTGKLEYKRIPDVLASKNGEKINKYKETQLKKAKYTSPEQLMTNLKSNLALENITLTDKQEAVIQQEFETTRLGDLVFRAGTEDKLIDDRTVQKKALRVMELVDALSPEDKEKFGTLEGRVTEAGFVVKGEYDSPAIDAVVVELGLLLETFARRQTGAAITNTEEERFATLVGALKFEPSAVIARAAGMITFANDMREAAYEQALIKKGGMTPENEEAVQSMLLSMEETYEYLDISQLNQVIDNVCKGPFVPGSSCDVAKEVKRLKFGGGNPQAEGVNGDSSVVDNTDVGVIGNTAATILTRGRREIGNTDAKTNIRNRRFDYAHPSPLYMQEPGVLPPSPIVE